MAEVLKDRVYYKNSGGGITLSGGEPLGQFEFALELLRLAKAEGLHTCVETCGYVQTEKLLEAAKFVDLFLFDWKITDGELHKKYIGADNSLIRENLEELDEIGAKVVLRCPIIPSVNDNSEHFCGISDLANSLACVTEIQIEPYHAFGTHKYSALSGEDSAAEFTVPDEAVVQRWIEEISAQTSVLVKLA
jgi:pyruvate formate lyase activating enzyme